MKEIGILTFHYVDNYGAVLQAWALRNILNSFSDINAEIINYVPNGYKILTYENSRDCYEKLKVKREAFEAFLTKNCNINFPMIDTVKGNEYDYYCVGSDQVWNMAISRETANYEYLLPHLDKEAMRFSYAASLGGKLDSKYSGVFDQYLRNFDHISVREKISVQDLEKYSKTKIEVVLDPTLLIDATEYDKLIFEPERKPEDFIFLFTYCLDENSMFEVIPFVNMLSRKYGLGVIHSFVNNETIHLDNSIGTMRYEGIGQFLWYLKNASIVVTSSYHGVLLAYIFGKQVYIIEFDYTKSRMEQIIPVLGLEKNIIDREWMFCDWEYYFEYNHDNLSIEREKSILYLKEATHCV